MLSVQTEGSLLSCQKPPGNTFHSSRLSFMILLTVLTNRGYREHGAQCFISSVFYYADSHLELFVQLLVNKLCKQRVRKLLLAVSIPAVSVFKLTAEFVSSGFRPACQTNTFNCYAFFSHSERTFFIFLIKSLLFSASSEYSHSVEKPERTQRTQQQSQRLLCRACEDVRNLDVLWVRLITPNRPQWVHVSTCLSAHLRRGSTDDVSVWKEISSLSRWVLLKTRTNEMQLGLVSEPETSWWRSIETLKGMSFSKTSDRCVPLLCVYLRGRGQQPIIQETQQVWWGSRTGSVGAGGRSFSAPSVVSFRRHPLWKERRWICSTVLLLLHSKCRLIHFRVSGMNVSIFHFDGFLFPFELLIQ